MSDALFNHGGLRFHSEKEIQYRGMAITMLSQAIREVLPREFDMVRVEGPTLHPREYINAEYGDDDLFVTNHKDFCLRAETTASSYQYARHILKRGKQLPLCVWQVGKSYRRETNDGASANKLRFNEFYQLEFQCIMPKTDKRTDGKLRGKLIKAVQPIILRLTNYPDTVVDSDRLPSYSESTKDIEVKTPEGWREIASCSLRNDFSDDTRVVEVAIGLDRIVELGTM